MIKYFSNLYTKKQLEMLNYTNDIPGVNDKSSGVVEGVKNDDGTLHTFEITYTGKKSTYNQNLYLLEFFR